MTADGPVAVAVVGPTAAGKSDLGIALALAVGGEVVNADSMQVYRGMDIGTAKVGAGDRRGVEHHLIDTWDVRTPVSVALYQDRARAAVDDIRARGRVPVVVGGSLQYARAVLDLIDFPGTDPVVRARLEERLAREGSAVLHAELAERDPQAAAAILPGNGRRIVRALEVVTLTGSFTAHLPEPRSAYPTVWLGLHVPRDVLDRRIRERVDRMWAAGLVSEVRGLVDQGLREAPTASRALGYRQVLAHLAGDLGDEDARTQTVRATCRFARRQERWLRQDHRVTWLPHDAPDLLQRALAAMGATTPSATGRRAVPDQGTAT